MTNLRTEEIVFFRNLKKICTDENKAIYNMYFQKQHYERIVPEKSGINMFSASHDNNLFSPIAMPHQFTVVKL